MLCASLPNAKEKTLTSAHAHTKTEYLDLSSNEFSGTIPSRLGDASNLVDVRLGSNEFGGQLPESLGNLQNLKILLMGNNVLTGTIPNAVGSLANNVVLQLHENGLHGPCPVFSSTNLGKSTRHGCCVHGFGLLDSHNNDCPGYQEMIHLDDNALTGSLPTIAASGSVRQIRMERNRFGGNIPAGLDDKTNLGAFLL